MKLMKNIVLLLTLSSLTSGLNLSAMETTAQALQPKLGSNNIYGLATPVDPKNTIIVWDLDDVVLEKHQKWVVASYLAWPRVLYRTNNLQKELKKLIGGGAAAEGIITYAEAKGDRYVAQFVSDVANTKTLNPEVVTIIKDIYTRGIKEYIASNMGQNGYAHIMKGTTPTDKEISDTFQKYFIGRPQLVDYSQVAELAKNPKSKIVILKKPNPEFFRKFFIENNINPKEVRTIFIDDKKDNITGFLEAAGENATGIVYKDYGQLRSDLEAIHVLVNQNSATLGFIGE